MKEIISLIGIIAVVAGMIFGVAYGGYKMYEFFAPRYTAVDNKVFHESQQYNDGMIRDLENLKMDYLNADKEHKDALRAITLHRFSVYPREKMPADLRNFYEQLESGRQ